MTDDTCPVCGTSRTRVRLLGARLAELQKAPAPSAANDPTILETFRRFWEAYPRKVGKIDATRAFSKLAPADRDAAADGAEALAVLAARARADRLAFLKHPATWLNGRGWEDGEIEWRRVLHLPILAGSPAPSAPSAPRPRRVDAGSPRWVEAISLALNDPLRPDVPDDYLAPYTAWLRGENPPEPEGWGAALDAARESARLVERNYR